MSLIDKVKRKVWEAVQKLVPHNAHYRPKNVYIDAAAYLAAHPNSGVKRHLIFDKYESKLDVTRRFYEKLSGYITYDDVDMKPENPIFRTVNDYVVVEIPNGRMVSNNLDLIAAITADGCVLGDVSYHQSPTKRVNPKDSKIMSQNWFNDPEVVEGNVFSLLAGGGAAINYGHWLVDALPRLELLEKAGLLGTIDKVVVPAYKHDYHRQSLAAYGIGPEKIIVADANTHIKAQNLILSSHPRGNRSYVVPRWIPELHRARFLKPEWLGADDFPELVYVSRKDSSIRQVVNEEELMEKLTPLGFKSFELAKLDFHQKVALFNKARVVISASGAGLNNMMFCEPGVIFFEIFPQGLVHTQFYNLAKYQDTKYHFMVCEPQKESKTIKQGRHEHTYVPPAEFSQVLDGVMHQYNKAKAAPKS